MKVADKQGTSLGSHQAI